MADSDLEGMFGATDPKPATEPVKEPPAPQIATEPAAAATVKNAGAPADAAVSTEPAKPVGDILDDPRAPDWAKSAVRDERKKRQELEREAAELRGWRQALEHKQKPAEPALDDDDQFYAAPPKYIKGVAQKEVGAVKSEIERLRYDLSEDSVRSAHQDYDDVVNFFAERAQGDPRLLAAFRAQAATSPDAQRNPARFAYEYAKTFREVGQVGSLAEYKAKIEREAEAKAEAKYRKQAALDAANQASTSTAGARSVGSAPVSSGPVTIESLFPGVGL